jgi:hypothetical protein
MLKYTQDKYMLAMSILFIKRQFTEKFTKFDNDRSNYIVTCIGKYNIHSTILIYQFS